MIKKFLLIFLFIYNPLSAIELQCFFEEVYEDSSTQQGLVLIKNDKLRYQYFDENLFTIFKNDNNFLIVENKHPEIFKKISHNTEVLSKISEIALKYPNINEFYKEDGLTIILEKHKTGFFVRRIGILSKNLNMSIFLNDCKKVSLQNKYLNFFPYFDYIPK